MISGFTHAVRIAAAMFFHLWLAAFVASSDVPDWARSARLAGSEKLGPWLSDSHIDTFVRQHHSQNVSVLLIWADAEQASNLTAADLSYLGKVASIAHSLTPPMRVIMYLAPLEQISENVDMDKDGKVDPGKHSVYSDHPGWMQVGIDGRPAVFYGAVAFWVGPHDEDAWVCPNDPQWRALEIAAFKRVGETGIDGVWWDRPEFMSDLGTAKWRDQWACHCSDCKALFKSERGRDIPATADFRNAAWRDWIDWRFEKMGDFISDCRASARKGNPGFILFNEFWDRTDWYTTEAGFSSVRTRAFHDGVAHEWNVREPPKKYKAFDWKSDLATYRAYRGFDGEHPSWILAYSQSIESSKTLASTQLQAGCNFYEVKYYEMVPSIDTAFRTKLFAWIRDNEALYYQSDLKPYANVAVYYSDRSIHWIDAPSRGNDDVYEEYHGLSILAGELHVAARVIDESALADLADFDAVLLPNAAAMNDAEISAFTSYVRDGGTLISTAETSLYDAGGAKRSNYGLATVFGVSWPANATVTHTYGAGLSIFAPRRLGQEYFAAVKPGSPKTDTAREKQLRELFQNDVWSRASIPQPVTLPGREWLAVDLYYDDSRIVARVTNYKGIKAPSQKPVPDKGVTLDIRIPDGFSPGSASIVELLGAERSQVFSQPSAGIVRFKFDVANHVAIELREVAVIRTDDPLGHSTGF